MICKKCGAQIDDNAVECPFCSAVYENNEPKKEEEAVSGDTQVFSTDEINKNAESAEEDNGSDIPDVPDEADELFDENEIKRRRQIERMRAEKQSQLEEIEQRRLDKKRKQKRNKIIAAAVIIICVAAVGTGAWYMLKDNDDGFVDEQPSATPVQTIEVPTLPVVSAAPEAASETPAATAGASWQSTGGGTSGSSSGGSSSSASSGSSSGASSGSSWRPTGSSSGTSSGSSGSGSSSSGSSSSSASSGSSSGGSSSSASSGSSSSGTPSTSYAVTGGKEYNASGGMTDGKFTAALITGVEIINNNGKNYMSFKYNGTLYYANINAGAYNELISGKPMTISAFPTSEMYNGSYVYEITSITHYNGAYIFPNSGFELLTEADLKGRSAWELALGRNEIYARHGRKFQMQEFQQYFDTCSWYAVNPNYNYDDDSANLNSIERENAKFIKDHE